MEKRKKMKPDVYKKPRIIDQLEPAAAKGKSASTVKATTTLIAVCGSYILWPYLQTTFPPLLAHTVGAFIVQTASLARVTSSFSYGRMKPEVGDSSIVIGLHSILLFDECAAG